MKKVLSRLAILSVVVAAAILAAPWGEAASAKPAAAPVAVAPATAVDFAAVLAAAEAEAAAATCGGSGMYEHNERDKCNKECKKGPKCIKKEMCGEERCPDPGYCWKCPK